MERVFHRVLSAGPLRRLAANVSLIGRFIAALVALILVGTSLAPSHAAGSMPYAATLVGLSVATEPHGQADHHDEDSGHEHGDLSHHAQAQADRVTANCVAVLAPRDPGSKAHCSPSDVVAPHGLAPAIPDEPPRG